MDVDLRGAGGDVGPVSEDDALQSVSGDSVRWGHVQSLGAHSAGPSAHPHCVACAKLVGTEDVHAVAGDDGDAGGQLLQSVPGLEQVVTSVAVVHATAARGAADC